MVCSCRKCPVFFLPVVSLRTAGPYSVAPAAAPAAVAAAAAAVRRLAMNFLVAAEAGGTTCGKENLELGSSTSQQAMLSSTGCWRGCAGPLR